MSDDAFIDGGKLPPAVAAHCAASAPIILQAARVAITLPDRVVVTGSSALLAPLVGLPSPSCSRECEPLITAVCPLRSVMGWLSRDSSEMARRLLATAARARPDQLVIVVFLATDSGVILADVERPAVANCNAPGGRA